MTKKKLSGDLTGIQEKRLELQKKKKRRDTDLAEKPHIVVLSKLDKLG